MIPEKDMHDLKTLSRHARGGMLDPERLAVKAYCMGSIACHQASDPIQQPDDKLEVLNLQELEKLAIMRALELKGNCIVAAQVLGIGKTTLYRKIKEYNLIVRSHVDCCPNCGRPLPKVTPLTQAA